MRGIIGRFALGEVASLWLGIIGFGVVIALIAAVLYIARRSRLMKLLRFSPRRRRSRKERVRMLRELSFYSDMLRILNRGGEHKPDWQPPLAFADRVAQRRPELAEPIRTLGSLYYAGRYGGKTLSSDERSAAAESLGKLRAAMQRRRRQ